MGPSNIPRRYWWVAAGAAAAVGLMYIQRRMAGLTAEEDPRGRSADDAPTPGPTAASPSAEPGPAREPAEDLPGGVRELAEFLAGESWFDEAGWKGLWEREGVEDPAGWLKDTGLNTLKTERQKLAEHPALLAGCRRRWLVVSRYAGIEVSDAAELWHRTDA